MNEENATVLQNDDFAEVQETEQASGAQEDAVDLPTENRDDDGLNGVVARSQTDETEETPEGETEETSEQQGEPAEQGKAEKAEQTRQQNAALRSARLAAQRQARESVEKTLSESGMVNPYTNKPIRTVQDLEQFNAESRQRRIEVEAQRTGRSVDDVRAEEDDRAFLRELRRERQTPPVQAFVADDFSVFMAEHPEFKDESKFAALLENKAFMRFCGSRLGKEPLGTLYDDYTELVGNAAAAAQVRRDSKSARSTGGAEKSGTTLSAAEAKALARWNAENPDMQMTAAEFKKR